LRRRLSPKHSPLHFGAGFLNPTFDSSRRWHLRQGSLGGGWTDRSNIRNAHAYDPSGKSYLEPEDSAIVDDFSWWALPDNQSFVASVGAIGSPTGFTMIINAHTSPDTLRRLYATANLDRGYYDYESFLPYVLGALDDIQWAYIPLSGEDDPALFVTSESSREFLARLVKMLKLKGQPHARIDRETQEIIIDTN
jgi:hypothetical protein